MGRSPSPARRREKERTERKKRRERRSRERRERDGKRDTEGASGSRSLRRRSQERERERERSRSRSRRRSRSRSHGHTSAASSSRRGAAAERPKLSEADLEGKTPEEVEMLKTMGFCTFDTTKNKKVEGNDVGEVHVILKRKYRQYMNRKGGFNRPLDFVA